MFSSGVGLAAVAVVAALVAVDRPLGGAAVGGVLLGGLAERGDVPAVADRPRPRRASASGGPCSSIRTNRPSVPFDALAPPPSDFGSPSSSGKTLG